MAEVLNAYLAEMAGRPFRYGEDDCASFVVGWFDRFTGNIALPQWRGQYSDAASCGAFIAAHGGFSEIASGFLGKHYGAVRASPQPGNAVLARFKHAEAMGLRVDDRRVALRTERGLLVTHRATVTDEWGIA